MQFIIIHIKETPEAEADIDHAVIKPISVSDLNRELAVIDSINKYGADIPHIPVMGYVMVDNEHALYMTPYLSYLKPLDYDLKTLPAVAAVIKGRSGADFDEAEYIYSGYKDSFTKAMDLLAKMQAAGIQHNDFEPQNIGSDLGGLVAHDFVSSEIYPDGNIPEDKKREDRVQFIDKMIRVGYEIGIPTARLAALIREMDLKADAPAGFMKLNPKE